MALLTKQGSFTKSTGGAPDSQVVTGIGFQPKALILFAVPTTSVGISAEYEFGIGFSDGTDDYSIAGVSEDAVITSDSDRRHAAKALVILLQNAVVAAECDLTSFNADGFTLNWTTNNASGYIIHYLAIGGDDLTNAKVGTFNQSASTGNQAITGTGFQPDIVFLMRIISSTTIPQTTIFQFPTLGMATDSSHQWAIGMQSVDNSSAADTDRVQETNAVVHSLGSTGLLFLDANFVSQDADGFTLNWILTGASRTFGYLALKGGQYAVGSDTQKTSTGTKATTGIGFTPKGLLLFSFNKIASVNPSTNNRFSLGGASAAGTEGSIWVGDTHGADPMSTDKATSTTKIIQLIDTDAPTAVDAEADLSSFDSDGFTLDWTTADAVARQFVYLAMGDAAAADINIDKWLGSRPDVIFDKERNQYFYPSFTIDPSQLTLPETSFPDKWHPKIQQPYPDKDEVVSY